VPEVQRDRVRIHYEIHGNGVPVVLLHGMGGSFEAGWQARGWVEPLTAAGCRVVGIDARGCGRSSRVEEPALLQGRPYVSDVLAVMDAEGVAGAHLIGYSMGAGHALGIALAAPQRVRSLVLGGLGGIALAMAGLYHEDARRTRERLVRAASMLGGLFAERDPYAPRYAAAYFEAIARDPLAAGALEQLAVPALLVVGDGDTAQGDFAALTVTQMLERRIPGARRLVLTGVNHGSCVRDTRFKAAVRQFLQEQEG